MLGAERTGVGSGRTTQDPGAGLGGTGGGDPDLTVSVVGAPAASVAVTLVPSDSRYNVIRMSGVIVIDSLMVGQQDIKWTANGSAPSGATVVKNNWVNDLTAVALTVQTGTDTRFITGDPTKRIFVKGLLFMNQSFPKVCMLETVSETITAPGLPFRNYGVQKWQDTVTAITSWGIVANLGGNVFGVGTKLNFWLEG